MLTRAGTHQHDEAQYTDPMAVPLFVVTPARLALEPLVAQVELTGRLEGEGCGAVCTFIGVVRGSHAGRTVRHLEYEAHATLAVRTFERIAHEAADRWPQATLAIHHRVGRLIVGETSVIVAAAAAHRDEAFRVCRYGIERVKQIAPVWKREVCGDGAHWIEGPVADPANDDLRRQALERACA